MTAARIQQLREFIAGGSCPRETVMISSKELLALLNLADPQLQRPQLGLSRQGQRYRNGVLKV